MVRVKRGVISNKTRRNVLKQVKGFRFSRGNKERAARDAIHHAGNHAFAHRRRKKSDFRRLFTVRLNGALRAHGISYSKFIDMLHKKNIALDRKVLSEIAAQAPEAFARIITEVQNAPVVSADAKAAAAAKKVAAKKAPAKTKAVAETAEVAPKAKKATAADITIIEGIGPKIATIFAKNGLGTFKSIASADVEKLRAILEDNKLAQHDPTTWPEQAEMAANGEWDELKKWQENHLAGRA